MVSNRIAVFFGLVLLGLSAVTAFPQHTPEDGRKPVPQQVQGTVEIVKAKAEANDVEAQLLLGCMYDSGNGVKLDYDEAFKWFLKAAEQGHPVAQFNVALMYAAGHGVPRNEAEAAKWYQKAEPADVMAMYDLGWVFAIGRGVSKSHGDAITWWSSAENRGREVAQRELGLTTTSTLWKLPDGKVIAESETVSVMTNTALGLTAYRGYKVASRELNHPCISFTNQDGTFLENVHVMGSSPVSIFYRWTDGTCCGETRLAKLPDHLQKQFGYEPKNAAKYEEEKARTAASAAAYGTHVQMLAEYPGVAKSSLASDPSEEAKKIQTLAEIVADYHKKSTSSKAADFMCAEMAMGLWNELRAQGIPAQILVGNVEEDMVSFFDANHAWVLAETSPGLYVALEATGGFVAYATDNPKYYFGHAFTNPKQFKDCIALERELWTAIQQYDSAIDKFDLQPTRVAATEADVRTMDVKEIRWKLIALLSGGR